MNCGKVLENKKKKKKKKKKEQRQPLDENRLQVSLRRRRHLTSISNVCSNELPQVGCEVPFILIGKKTMAFLTDKVKCLEMDIRISCKQTPLGPVNNCYLYFGMRKYITSR